mmetsp:Transcript_16907/g.14830  ORF Transcript_16907/g.14830 Transcript_16907/m.14830 type:complete len:277 (+) Transcript_16907:425-1255(+)
MHVCYIPVAIVGTLIFFTFSILIIPIAYVALVYQNLILCFQKNLPLVERKSYVVWTFMIIFKEPFVLLILTIGDTIHFIRSLYYQNLKINTENSFNKLNDLRDLDRHSFNIFRKKLAKYKNTLVNIKELIRDLREEFHVSYHLHKIIYSCYEENDTTKYIQEKFDSSNENLSQEFTMKNERKANLKECSSFYAIRQFNLLKKFVVTNSIPFDTPSAKKVPQKNRDRDQQPKEEEDKDDTQSSDGEYNLDALRKFKMNKIKKRRVIDASKILKIIEE